MTWPMRLLLGLIVVAAAGVLAFRFALSTDENPATIRVSGTSKSPTLRWRSNPRTRRARLVDEGMLVKKDDVVAVLDSSDLRQEVDLRRAEVAAAQAALAELEAEAGRRKSPRPRQTSTRPRPRFRSWRRASGRKRSPPPKPPSKQPPLNRGNWKPSWLAPSDS